MLRLLILSLMMILAVGCEHLKIWEEKSKAGEERAADDPESHSSTANQDSAPENGHEKSKSNGMELRQAKLWSRIDILETELLKQKERLRILEKGLLLGIIPEEMRRGHQKAPLPPEPAHEDEEAMDQGVVATPQKEDPPKIAELPKIDPAAYQSKLAQAQGLFNGGHYGQAIVLFSEIGHEFPVEQTGGHHLYWIGVSWYHLKEYQLASQSLEDFLKQHANSPWAPKAKLAVARVNFRMGFTDKALANLRHIIQEYPEHEVSDMAKLELKKFEERL